MAFMFHMSICLTVVLHVESLRLCQAQSDLQRLDRADGQGVLAYVCTFGCLRAVASVWAGTWSHIVGCNT